MIAGALAVAVESAPLRACRFRGGSSAGRASRSQCEGRELDPPPLHHTSFPRKSKVVRKAGILIAEIPALPPKTSKAVPRKCPQLGGISGGKARLRGGKLRSSERSAADDVVESTNQERGARRAGGEAVRRGRSLSRDRAERRKAVE